MLLTEIYHQSSQATLESYRHKWVNLLIYVAVKMSAYPIDNFLNFCYIHPQDKHLNVYYNSIYNKQINTNCPSPLPEFKSCLQCDMQEVASDLGSSRGFETTLWFLHGFYMAELTSNIMYTYNAMGIIVRPLQFIYLSYVPRR